VEQRHLGSACSFRSFARTILRHGPCNDPRHAQAPPAKGKTYQLDLTDPGVVQRSNLIAAIMERSNLHRVSPRP